MSLRSTSDTEDFAKRLGFGKSCEEEPCGDPNCPALTKHDCVGGEYVPKATEEEVFSLLTFQELQRVEHRIRDFSWPQSYTKARAVTDDPDDYLRHYLLSGEDKHGLFQ